MDRENYDMIIERYLDKFDYTNEKGPEEWFKWAAIACFQENWDIDAPDFYDMFVRSVKKFDVLIDNSHSSPVNGLKELIKIEGETDIVRNAFRDLFADDGGDITLRQQKAEIFVETINKRIEKHWYGSHMYPQSIRSAILFLTMLHPEENYILFWSRAYNWANYTEFGFDFGSGTSFSLPFFYRMCDEVRDEIKKDPRLQICNRKRMEAANVNFEDDYHTLVYDIIYCATCYNLYIDIPSYEPGTGKRIQRAKERAILETLKSKMITAENDLNAFPVIDFPTVDMTGHYVKSKAFGEGQVVSQIGNRMHVQFGETCRPFVYPDAILQNYLTPASDSDLEKITKRSEYENHIKEAKGAAEFSKEEYSNALAAFNKKWIKRIRNEEINTSEDE